VAAIKDARDASANESDDDVRDASKRLPETSIDAETKSVDLEAAKVLSARPLIDRIQDYARARGFDVRPMGSDPSLASTSEPSRYNGRADYVVEIAGPRGVRQPFVGGDSWWRFNFDARGRLVRVSDGVVVDTFSTSNVTDISRNGTGVHEQRVPAEIDAAIQSLAVAIVDKWIAPAAPELGAIAIFDSSGEIDPNVGQQRQVNMESGPPDTNSATEQDAIPKAASDDDEPRLPQSTASAASPAAPQPLAAMPPTPTPAPAKPVAIEVGGLRQGDRWEYAFVDSRNGRPTSRRFEIEQIDGDSIVERIEMKDGRRVTVAHHRGAYLNMLGGMQLAPYYFGFQPEAATGPVGSLKAEGGDACASRSDAGGDYQLMYECEIQADSLGIESIAVPAGTFPAHVVRVTVDAQAFGGHNARRFNVVNARFWISPKAGRIVKAMITYEADHPWTETMELVSYPTGDRMKGSRPTAVGRELTVTTGS
jgi:hypothetical protein